MLEECNHNENCVSYWIEIIPREKVLDIANDNKLTFKTHLDSFYKKAMKNLTHRFKKSQIFDYTRQQSWTFFIVTDTWTVDSY